MFPSQVYWEPLTYNFIRFVAALCVVSTEKTTWYQAVKIIEKRDGAPVAVECYVDETPEEDKPKPRSAHERIDAAWAERATGTCRPTKRVRRQMEKFTDIGKKRRR